MSKFRLPISWLLRLSNSHHDHSTQQIDDTTFAYVTDNVYYNEKKQVVHQCRQHEDAVWLTIQHDPAVRALVKAFELMLKYIRLVRYVLRGFFSLSDDDPLHLEAEDCLNIFKDFRFSFSDTYAAASDKVIQIRENFLPHEAFLTQIGIWSYYELAFQQANEVRSLLSDRAFTKGKFVKRAMKDARKATDKAIADLYSTILAMNEISPSEELTTLITQLKGYELYAKQYYINSASPTDSGTGSGSGSGSGTGTGTGTGSGSGSGTGTDSDGDIGGGTGTGTGTGTGSGSGTGSGTGTGTGSGSGDDTGGSGSDSGGTTPPPTDITDDGIE